MLLPRRQPIGGAARYRRGAAAFWEREFHATKATWFGSVHDNDDDDDDVFSRRLVDRLLDELIAWLMLVLLFECIEWMVNKKILSGKQSNMIITETKCCPAPTDDLVADCKAQENQIKPLAPSNADSSLQNRLNVSYLAPHVVLLTKPSISVRFDVFARNAPKTITNNDERSLLLFSGCVFWLWGQVPPERNVNHVCNFDPGPGGMILDLGFSSDSNSSAINWKCCIYELNR